MKLSFTLIEILVVSSVFVPFLIFVYKGLNSTSKTKHKAEKITKLSGFNYKLKEVWNNKFIGIAQDDNMLTYIQFNNDNHKIYNLKLSDIKSCELVTNYKIGKDKVTRLEYLDLKIAFHSFKKEEVTLHFFNTDDGYTEDYEMRRIENWNSIINDNINASLKKAS